MYYSCMVLDIIVSIVYKEHRTPVVPDCPPWDGQQICCQIAGTFLTCRRSLLLALMKFIELYIYLVHLMRVTVKLARSRKSK